MPADHRKGKTKVLVVDDHPVMREGIAMALERQADLMVCGQAEDGAGALQAIADLKPDLAIVDIGLKESDGIFLVKEIRRRWPNLPVLVLTMHEETLYGERALRAGARGYVTRSEPAQAVVEGIRRVLAGGIYVSERLHQKILRAHIEAKAPQAGLMIDTLSDREFEVFGLLGQGLPVREIAARLDLSVKTIETHQARMKKKLCIDNSTELHRYAVLSAQQQPAG